MSSTSGNMSPRNALFGPPTHDKQTSSALASAIHLFLLARTDGISRKRKRNEVEHTQAIELPNSDDDAPSSPRKMRKGALSSCVRLRDTPESEDGDEGVVLPDHEDTHTPDNNEVRSGTRSGSWFFQPDPNQPPTTTTTPPSSPPLPSPVAKMRQLDCPNCHQPGHGANDTLLCPLLIYNRQAAVIEQFPRHLRNAKRERRLFRIETEAKEHSFHGGDPELNEMLKTRYEQEWERKWKLRRRGGLF